MDIEIRRYPLLFLLVFYSAGVLLYIFRVDSQLYYYSVVLVLLSILFISCLFAFKTGYVVFLCIIMGIANTYYSDPSQDKLHISKLEKIEAIEGVISSENVEKNKSTRTILSVTKVKTEIGWQVANGSVLVYFRNPINPTLLNYKNKVLIKGEVRKVESPKNPEEFNIARYYSFHHIYNQLFVEAGEVVLLDSNTNWFDINLIGIEARKKLRDWFKQYFKQERERHIASALIIGIKDGIDTATLEAYSATGSMHVLAVSGLHVGFFYSILLLISTIWSPTNKKVKYLQYGIQILILWFYALVTGMSPSVVRAVLMLSFIIIAKVLDKKSQVLNTLFATAFVILVFNPYMLMEVGFQLSFVAVFGIVTTYAYFYKLYLAPNKLIDWIWSVVVMSTVAQLFTFPLGILYFHHFPLYFLLTNLIIIPLSIVILYGGILFLIFCPISSFVAKYVSKVVEWLVYLMNETIFYLEKLPYASLKNLYIDILDTWIIYATILCLMAWILLNKKKYVYGLLSMAFLLSINIILTVLKQGRVNELIVFNVPKNASFAFVKNRNMQLYMSPTLELDRDKQKFHLSNYFIKNGIVNKDNRIAATQEDEWSSFYVFNKQKVIHIHNRRQYLIDTNWVKDAILIISNNGVEKRDLLEHYLPKCKKIIIDDSNSRFYIEKIAEVNNKKIYQTNKQGAFVYKFG